MTTVPRLIRTLGLASALSLSLFFVGCASLPSPEVMKAETASYKLPALPSDGHAMVYVVRPSPLGGLIRFNVFVNEEKPDAEMGYTRGSQYIYFQLKPGTYKLLSKAENLAEVEVVAKAGDIIFVDQEPTMGIIMARNSLFTVPDYQGKYHVKTLSLGTVIKTSN